MIRVSSLLMTLLDALSRRRTAVAALSAATVVLAAIAVTQMPLQLLPEIRYPQVRVIGDLPGQTSRVIEESINEPMEAALAGTPGMVQMESRAGDGRAYVDLFFEPDYDLDRAVRDVTQSAQRAQDQIPDEFPEPRIFPVSTTEEPVLQFAFGSQSRSAPEIRRQLRANLLPQLRATAGVDAVYMGREEISELVVDIDPAAQTSQGVGLDTIEEALLQATDPPPSSAMRTAHFDGIGVLGTDGWAAPQLTERPLFFGDEQTIALGSIAAVHRAPSQESLRTRLDGQSAVLLTVYRSPQADALEMADEANRLVETVDDSEAFADIDATVLYDDSVVTRTAVRSVVVAAVGGALLAMLLLFFVLRNRRYVPLVAALVGVSLSAAIVVLYAMGQSLNLLTLAGLLLSVGLGLDYAIIYFDRLDRLAGRDSDTDRPHLKAMVDVAGPLLGALLTTWAAILPFLLVEGLVALLFQPLIWTVVICAGFSFVFAVVLLPTFARSAPSEDGDIAPRSRPSWWAHLQRPVAAWGIVGLLAITLVWGGQKLPFEVLPVVDDGFVDIRITHPAGIPTDDLDRLTRQVESELQSLEGTDALFTTVGGYFREGQPSFRPGTSNFMIRIDTDGGDRPSEAWAEDARRAIDELGVPELSTSVTLPRIRGVQTRLSDADLIAVLTREDGDILGLSQVENRVIDRLEDVDGLQDVERIRGGVSPRWIGHPDYRAMADHGVEPDVLERVVDYALDGRVLRQRMEGGEPLALRVRYDRRRAGGPQHLAHLRLLSNHTSDVHLGDVVDFDLIEEPTHIERREGQRVVRVAAQFDPAGPAPGEIAEEVEKTLLDTDLSEGTSWWLEGEVEALEETSRTFAMALALALMMVLTLLIIQYGSFSFAACGLIAIPLSATGTIALLAIFSRPLDAMVLAGLLIAVGIVANNVILVLSEAKNRANEGTDLSEALSIAAYLRLRPIVLTVVSTVVGMSPLLFGGAEVFGLLQPLAIALTGALIVSVPITCVLLPSMTSSMTSVARRLSARLSGGETGDDQPPS